jgi:hypothetical protein
MTTLVASVDLKFYKNPHLNEPDTINRVYNFHLLNGILFEIESLLSCYSNEYYMIYDHFCTIQRLNNVFIHLPVNLAHLLNETTTANTNAIHIDLKT